MSHIDQTIEDKKQVKLADISLDIYYMHDDGCVPSSENFTSEISKAILLLNSQGTNNSSHAHAQSSSQSSPSSRSLKPRKDTISKFNCLKALILSSLYEEYEYLENWTAKELTSDLEHWHIYLYDAKQNVLVSKVTDIDSMLEAIKLICSKASSDATKEQCFGFYIWPSPSLKRQNDAIQCNCCTIM